jgi:hypothetical protein
MAGLVPAIHVLLAARRKKEDVDARHKAGHDESESDAADHEWQRVVERGQLHPLAYATQRASRPVKAAPVNGL